MEIRYGKKLGDIIDIKQSFIEDNDQLLEDNKLLAKIARQQIRRTVCKNCAFSLPSQHAFIKHEIKYFYCENCGQLNGGFEDTPKYAEAVYIEEVTSYSKYYDEESVEKWNSRVDKIYKPKAQFLIECLEHESIENMPVCDIGAGSGYFIKALEEYGFENVRGYELSEKQIRLGNSMLGKESLIKINLDNLDSIISKSNCTLVSMIGVLEHLTNPREILDSISRNEKIEYIFISLPLFSYSVFFELNNQDIFNRHLSGAHTHLYTMESIRYFCKEFNFDILGEWHFGVDAMDLFRFNLLSMKKAGASEEMLELFNQKFLSIMDDIQLVFDKSEFSSEVHLLLKVKH